MEENSQRLPSIQTSSSRRSTLSRERAQWDPTRAYVASILEGPWFSRLIGSLIVFNVVILIIETNQSAECVVVECTSDSILDKLNFALLIIYTIELVLRIYVYRVQCLCISWNLVDGLVVFFGYLDMILTSVAPDIPNLQLLRIFRVTRMFRSGRLVNSSPELYTYIRGFAAAMRAMFWGVVIVMFMLLIFSIVSVQLVHSRNVALFEENHPCRDVFVSVQDAILYFFQITVTGDLGLLNMILSVIVDSAAAAREDDLEHKAALAEKDKEESSDRLYRIIQEIDVDNSGCISQDELLNGYDNEESDFKSVVASLHIGRDELGRLFRCLDEDKTGALEYREFVKQIQKAHSSDLRVQFMLLKMEMKEMSHNLQEQISLLHRVQEAVSDKGTKLLPSTSPPSQEQQRDPSPMFAEAIRAIWASPRLPDARSSKPVILTSQGQLCSDALGIMIEEDARRSNSSNSGIPISARGALKQANDFYIPSTATFGRP